MIGERFSFSDEKTLGHVRFVFGSRTGMVETVCECPRVAGRVAAAQPHVVHAQLATHASELADFRQTATDCVHVVWIG